MRAYVPIAEDCSSIGYDSCESVGLRIRVVFFRNFSQVGFSEIRFQFLDISEPELNLNFA